MSPPIIILVNPENTSILLRVKLVDVEPRFKNLRIITKANGILAISPFRLYGVLKEVGAQADEIFVHFQCLVFERISIVLPVTLR